MAAGRYRRSVDDGSDHTPGRQPSMRLFQIAAAALAFLSMDPAMAQERIRISSDWGNVTAELADNAAARSLLQMLPITIDMRDHLRQEKTGNLPSPLPEVPRQRDFAVGTLGLWGPDHFVIYYRTGPCPPARDRDPRQRDRRCLDLRPSGSDHRSRRSCESVRRPGVKGGAKIRLLSLLPPVRPRAGRPAREFGGGRCGRYLLGAPDGLAWRDLPAV